MLFSSLMTVFLFAAGGLDAFGNSSMKQYQWKKRVVSCGLDLIGSQKEELGKNEDLAKDLKLELLENQNLRGKCQLIGLDSSVKRTKRGIFLMQELENVINSMPMRKAELQERES